MYNKEEFPKFVGGSTRQPLNNHGKIRIGYLSGELREQATSHLIVGVLESHNHSRFEIYGMTTDGTIRARYAVASMRRSTA